MGASSRLSVRQILGGFCLGFGLAAYMFGLMAYIWLSQTFVVGYTNAALFWTVALMPGLLMVIGTVSIAKSRKTYE